MAQAEMRGIVDDLQGLRGTVLKELWVMAEGPAGDT